MIAGYGASDSGTVHYGKTTASEDSDRLKSRQATDERVEISSTLHTKVGFDDVTKSAASKSLGSPGTILEDRQRYPAGTEPEPLQASQLTATVPLPWHCQHSSSSAPSSGAHRPDPWQYPQVRSIRPLASQSVQSS
jgi:hypothetical protein